MKCLDFAHLSLPTVQYSTALQGIVRSTEPKYDSNSAAPPLVRCMVFVCVCLYVQYNKEFNNSIPTVGIARDPTGVLQGHIGIPPP